jgi:hypothetical protein
MRKFLITTSIILVTLWVSLTSLMNSVRADDYTKAVIGHVVQTKVNGTNVDVNKLFEQEMERVAHQFTLEMIVVMQTYLPAILDGVAADLRMKADKEYKCKLLSGTKIKDDCK